MTVIGVTTDPELLTMTFTAAFDAPPERVWQVWADPRQLERWWGPPGYPATVVDHDLRDGGRATYFMTGPDGTRHHGWWRFDLVRPPERIEFVDGFADADGVPDDAMPTMAGIVTIAPREGGGSQMIISARFRSAEDMARLAEMGIEQGMTMALDQIPAIVADETQETYEA